jgi:hypothetical protein
MLRHCKLFNGSDSCAVDDGDGVDVCLCCARVGIADKPITRIKQTTIKSGDVRYVLYIRVDSFNLAFEIDGEEDLNSVWNANTGRNSKEMRKTGSPWQILLNATVLVLLLASSQAIRAQAKLESVYSDLSESKCKTIEVDKETGSSTQRCPGIAGYKLLVLDDDARQSITVVAPGGKQHALDFWGVVTHAFSSVGKKAEWRVTRTKGKISPVALIVRVNASEDSANPSRLTSYLTVVKILAEEICVTQKVPPGARANETARQAADSAPTAACLKEVSP